MRMLHYLYKADRATYPDERQRVQQGFLIIIHAFSGVRPSSATKTGTRHVKKRSGNDDEHVLETEELVKLRYRDLQIVITTDAHGRTRFAVCPTFNHFKGDLKRPQQFVWPLLFYATLIIRRKTFTWCDQADVLTCPVAHFVALALFDRAFLMPNLCDAKSVFSLTAPVGKKLHLPWHPDILSTPILRASREVSGSELSGGVSLSRLTTLCRNVGFTENITWYSFRRLVLNAVDGKST